MAGMPFQAHPCQERVWVDPDMGAILTIKGLVRGRRFWLLFSLERKVTRALAHKSLQSIESIGVRNSSQKENYSWLRDKYSIMKVPKKPTSHLPNFTKN